MTLICDGDSIASSREPWLKKQIWVHIAERTCLFLDDWVNMEKKRFKGSNIIYMKKMVLLGPYEVVRELQAIHDSFLLETNHVMDCMVRRVASQVLLCWRGGYYYFGSTLHSVHIALVQSPHLIIWSSESLRVIRDYIPIIKG